MPIVAGLDPAKYGLSYVFKGKETVDGKEYLVLERAYPDGLRATLYVDSETYLVPKEKAKIMGQGGVEADVEQIMSDFRKGGEMIMAHTIITYQNGAEYSKISFKDVKFNTGLEDSLFVMRK